MISEEDFIYQSYTQQLLTYQKQCSDLLSQVGQTLPLPSTVSLCSDTNILHHQKQTDVGLATVGCFIFAVLCFALQSRLAVINIGILCIDSFAK